MSALDTTPTARGESLPARTQFSSPPVHHAHLLLYSVAAGAITFSVLMGWFWKEALRERDEAAQQTLLRDNQIRTEAHQRAELETRLHKLLDTMPPACPDPPAPTPTVASHEPEPPTETAGSSTRLHTLQKEETVLSLGYRFCAVKKGDTTAERTFLNDVFTLNRTGVRTKQGIRPLRSTSQLNIVHEGEQWVFPASCKPRLDNHLKSSSQL